MNGFTTIAIEGGRVDGDTRRVEGRRGDTLSPTEARLLAFLADRPGATVARGVLLREVWGLPDGSTSRTLFATIERLRRKLERDPKHPRHVVTIGRDGYAFRPADAPETPVPAAPPPPAADAEAFVGRGRERAWLDRALAAPHAVATLHGPGGVGKSRLAAEWLGDRPRWWVPLETASDAAEVRERVARALDVVVDPDPARAAARLGRVARDGLLVLDGADALAAEVGRLVAGFGPSGPRVLVTSRVPLGVPGEQVLALAPLDLGGSPSEAARLFLRAAARRRPGHRPTPDELAAIEALVAALDGLPLAIEVAASWAAVASVDELRARARALDRLPPDDDRPGRTVREAVARSWDQLDEGAREALRACVTFEGPFDAAAADAVLGDGARDALRRLADRSLVQVDDGAAPRFRVLLPIRAFVRDQGPDPAAAARHAAWFAARARASLARLEAGGSRADYAEVLAAQADVERAAEAADDDGAAACALALAAVFKDLGPVPRWLEVVERGLRRTGASAALRVRLHVSRAAALRYVGRAAEARPELVAAAALARAEAPDRRAAVAVAQGTLESQCGDAAAAEAHLREALDLARGAGDAHGEAVAHAELATVAWRRHDLVDAGRGYREALRGFRRLGATHPEAVYLGNLGVVELTAGRFALAEDALREALALHRRTGSVRFESATLSNLGLVAERRGRWAEARGWFEAALALAQRTGDARDEVITWLNLADLAVSEGRITEARRRLEAADPVLDGLGLTLQAVDAAMTWAAVHRVEGDREAATAAADRALALGARHGLPIAALRVRALRALLAADAGDGAGARAEAEALGRALDAAGLAREEVPELTRLRRELSPHAAG